jgi:adenine-specific DNA-methyltransferase
MISLKEKLENLLKKKKEFLDENGDIDYIKIKDLADKIDNRLIELLITNNEVKKKFFSKIKDVYVFNINHFKFFLDESKVNNSYTQYKNRIGLSDGKEFIQDENKIVLNFPFKDCVLEGGQSTEEGVDTYYEYDETVTKAQEKQGLKANSYNQKTAKRNEIFFNQILAHDEIDRLYDRKAFVNWARFNKDTK